MSHQASTSLAILITVDLQMPEPPHGQQLSTASRSPNPSPVSSGTGSIHTNTDQTPSSSELQAEPVPQHEDMHIPGPEPVALGHQLPQACGQGPRRRALPILTPVLNAQDILADPWSSELAHTFHPSVRRDVLTKTLSDLETRLNISSSS